jgi:magnesium chelatase family protein
MAGEPGHTCRRGDRCASDYQARISGPLLDRIDLRVEVPSVSARDLISPAPAETSENVALRVAAARERQRHRYETMGLKTNTNAHASSAAIEEVAKPDAGGMALLQDAAEAMHLSARAYHRILKVALTLADLDGVDKIGRIHLAEAISYRTASSPLARAA